MSLVLIIVVIIVIIIGWLIGYKVRAGNMASEPAATKQVLSRAPKIKLQPIVPDNKPSTGTRVRFVPANPVREYDKTTGAVRDVGFVPMS